ncbi:hypothetical protein BKG94_05100 [Rodentibacter ratti]|uniref:hypothetical protein n=1 Tax=Rodentibacter ratti TaxID=1906745 RepID=UPI000984D3EF|nr:hypothetical protein [Rodentibacter ratti]OOF88522.1 hypothetical protein BKG94_05100 [Rodentibacter ratti]
MSKKSKHKNRTHNNSNKNEPPKKINKESSNSENKQSDMINKDTSNNENKQSDMMNKETPNSENKKSGCRIIKSLKRFSIGGTLVACVFYAFEVYENYEKRNSDIHSIASKGFNDFDFSNKNNNKKEILDKLEVRLTDLKSKLMEKPIYSYISSKEKFYEHYLCRLMTISDSIYDSKFEKPEEYRRKIQKLFMDLIAVTENADERKITKIIEEEAKEGLIADDCRSILSEEKTQ